jgi:prepilin-type N-terminal cleavage/methylation domain-containing protein
MRSNKQRGFSLIELMVVLVILSAMTGAIFMQINNAQARSNVEQTKLDMFQESRQFMDQMSRDLHQTGYPNVRNFAADPGVNNAGNAVGLVKVDVDHLWFEGDIAGTGNVSSVQYQLQATGNNCPCLRRSQVNKLAGNPITGNAGTDFQAEVQNVQNGTTANPIFRAYRADGTQVTLPVDFNSNGAEIASISTIQVTLAVQSTKFDFQARIFPQATLNSVINLRNCSQAATGSPMSCQVP